MVSTRRRHHIDLQDPRGSRDLCQGQHPCDPVEASCGREDLGRASCSKRAVASELGKHLEIVIASIREPSDLTGLPVRVNGHLSFAPPRWGQVFADHGGGIVFYDEISTVPGGPGSPARVYRRRVIGNLELPSNISRLERNALW